MKRDWLSARIASLALSIGLISFLKLARRAHRAELAGGVDAEPVWRGCLPVADAANTGNEGSRLCAWITDPDCVSLSRNAGRGADIDVVTAGSQIRACLVASAMLDEPLKLFSSAPKPVAVLLLPSEIEERRLSDGNVFGAVYVHSKRIHPVGGVVAAVTVEK